MDLFALKTLLSLFAFIGCCAGMDVLPEGPVDAVLGKNVTLKTLLAKPSYVVLLWNFNDGTETVNVATVTSAGLKVNEPYKGRATLNTTTGSLFLGSLKSEDSGDYSISIIAPEGTTLTGETKLRVLEPVSAVTIKSNVPEAIEHNSTVALTCTAKGSFLKFTWLKGATPIVADKRITLKEEDMSSTLTITDVLRTDLLDPVTCTAANKLETEKSAPFTLPVFYGPDMIKITPPNPPKYVGSKSVFNLTCTAASSPAATFSWYHKKDLMEVAGPVLTLKAIQDHGFGKQMDDYSCTATNTKTKRVVASPAVSFAVMEPISGAKVSGPTVTLIAGNGTANLSCKATAGTVKTITWQKDGKVLSAGGRLTFAADMSSVMIKPLQKEDNGEYTCTLENPVNSDKASYKMMVNYGPEAATVIGPEAVEVTDIVTLTCTAGSVPAANFTWKFNGTLTPIKTAQYKVEMARYKNSGTYTCEAHNAVTGKTTAATHKLSVNEEGSLDEGLSDGAIAGIVIAVLVALAAAIGLIIYCRQKVPVESPY